MKLITRLLLGLIAVVATLFMTAAFVVSTTELAQHKDRIQQFVFDQTGRSLVIRGRVDAQLFPWAGFSLQDVSLAGADGFYTRNFANVEHVEARVRFLPLLIGNVSIKHVHLQGLELDLQRNLEGRTNWDDLMSNTSVVATEGANDDVIQEIEAGTPVVAALSVGELIVSDSVVHWRDELAENEFILSDFRLAAGEVTLTEPFPFETGFVVNGVDSFPMSRIAASGLAGINLAENIYRVDSFQVDSVLTLSNDESAADPEPVTDDEVENSSEKQPVDRKLTTRYSGSVVVDLNAQRVDFAPLTLDVEGVVLSGELHVTDLLENPGVFGYVANDSVDASGVLEAQLEKRGVELPATFDRALLQDFKLSASFQRADENFLINDVRLGNQHAELTGNFQIANFLRAPVLTGTITSNNINPALWTEAIGFAPVDKTALTKAQISTAVRQSGQLLGLNDIELHLDDSTINGDIEFVKTDEGQFPVRFELRADTINLDRYFHNRIDSSMRTLLSDEPAKPLPIETIDTMDVQGELSITQLQWSGLEFTDVSLPVRIADGRVEGLEVKATAYKGTWFASTVLDVTPDEPLLTATMSVNAVDLQTLSDALLQREANLSGTGIVNIDLLSRGMTVAELVNRAGGALNVRVTDGTVSGVNIAKKWVTLLSEYLVPDADEIEADVAKSDSRSITARQKTGINELSVSWELADGRLYSNDLDLRSAGLNVTGQGSIDLARLSVDYLLQVAIVEATADAAIDDIDSMLAPTHNRVAGVTLPLIVRGPVKPLISDFIGQLNKTLQVQLQKPDIFGAAAAESTGATFDISTIKNRLEQTYQDAEVDLNGRLDALRDAAQQQNKAPSVEQEKEASNSINEEIERETNQLKNRLQNNLRKDLKRKLSNLTED